MRALILAAGVLLVVAFAVFLAVGKWRNILNSRDIPKRLGVNIQQEANGVTYTQSHGGHVVFKIHASRAEELKNKQSMLQLHDVKIEFFAPDGHVLDSIAGNEFAYNRQAGIATAQGRVNITLSRSSAPPPGTSKSSASHASQSKVAGKLPVIPSTVAGVIHVETSGLSFNQNTGVATTSQKVSFSMAQGSGTAMGADYNSQQGLLTLNHAVRLTTTHGGQTVVVHARHAEFKRNAQLCQLLNATAHYKGGQAILGKAKIYFRNDGSAQRLTDSNGFTLATTTGGRLTAPSGSLQFNEHNQPLHGEMQGGVKLNSTSAGRQLHGSAPGAELHFSPQGQLRTLQLNHGAEISSESEAPATGSHSQMLRVSRTWRSPSAYIDFRSAGKGKVEPAVLHGSGGVVVTSQTRRGHAAPLPMRLTADQVTGKFGPNSELTSIIGVGHAGIQQTTAEGARQDATGDRIVVQFTHAAGSAAGHEKTPAAEIQSAVLDGHVVFIQHPASHAGAQSQAPIRATAGRAVYQNAGQWLHLTQSPRVQDAGLEISATKIDVSQQSGKAFAHGNVKATWLDAGATNGGKRRSADASAHHGLVFGGQNLAHVVAADAQFDQSNGQAIFRGHARLWQQANSIAAPVIVLNRDKQTVVARSSNPGEPVRAVLLGTTAAAAGLAPGKKSGRQPEAQSSAASVIRVSGGEFTYSEAKHQAVMVGGTFGSVKAETGTATCIAHQVVLLLKPRTAHATGTSAEVESVTARGDVNVSSQGRSGTGAKLVYSSRTGDYILTGTRSAPPRLTDPARGTVTGAALIFNSRNDSVSIEGRGHETRTNTTAPK